MQPNPASRSVLPAESRTLPTERPPPPAFPFRAAVPAARPRSGRIVQGGPGGGNGFMGKHLHDPAGSEYGKVNPTSTSSYRSVATTVQPGWRRSKAVFFGPLWITRSHHAGAVQGDPAPGGVERDPGLRGSRRRAGTGRRSSFPGPRHTRHRLSCAIGHHRKRTLRSSTCAGAPTGVGIRTAI
jgi:hypothetical protein